MLTLQELTQKEFDEWFARSTRRQAEDRAWASGRPISVELEELEAMIPMLLPDGRETAGHIFRLALDEDLRTVAFAWFGAVPGMPESTIFLFDIAVIPEARRQGYGREVLTQLIEEFQDEGMSEIYLNVLSNNHGAIALYKELGFSVTESSESDKHLEMKKLL